jgi:hypothetical protein
MLLVFMTDDVHMTQSSFGELTKCKSQATQVVVALTSHLVYGLLVAFVHRKVRPYNGRVVHPAPRKSKRTDRQYLIGDRKRASEPIGIF